MSSSYPRGSEWRRWDLHLHTPETARNDNFTGSDPASKWQNFATTINEYTHPISVVGITDYFSIDNYRKFKKLVADGTISKQLDLILPNVELRILPVTNGAVPVNIHCIFSPDVADELENRFFNKLIFSSSGTEYSCTKNDLIRLGRAHNSRVQADDEAYKTGREQFVIGHDRLIEVFKKDQELRQQTIIAVSNNNSDGASGIRSHEDYLTAGGGSQLDATRRAIYENSDCIFSGNPADTAFFLGEKTSPQDVLEKCGRIKPCIHGCDAHENSKIFEPDSKRYCWIKADPTFEGLKQIIYEPAERVRIVEKDPGLQFDKPYFDEITINSNVDVFEDTEDQATFLKDIIPLNRNMVAIIGGRGSGKSLLIDYLGTSVFDYKNNRDSTLTSSVEFTASYSKNNQTTPEKSLCNAADENYVDFLFIPQGRLKSITKSSHLNEEIKSLLELDDLKFSEGLTDEIDDTLNGIEENELWFENENEFGERINDKRAVRLKKAKFEKLLESITTKENQQKLEKYSKNIEDIEDLEQDKHNLESVQRYIDEAVSGLNNMLEGLEKYKIPKLDTKAQKSSIKTALAKIDKTVKLKKDENIKIKEEFKSIFTGDLSKLLKNAEQYKRAIKASDRKLEEIKKIETKQEDLVAIRSGFGKKIQQELERQRDLITTRWEKVFDQFEDETQKKIIKRILKDRKIEIKGEIVFDRDAFYSIVEQHANLNYFKNTIGQTKTRRERMLEWLKIKDLSSFVNFIEDNLSKHCDDEEETKKWINGGIENIIFDLKTRAQYLYTQATVTYKNKPINKLSAGQRGTTYLCIQLARNAFSSPIIFDQPEDDLDNEFIINDLVDIFKELKKYRQIIIVTHNANLVVNSDAEQVIVAHNDDEKLAYLTGSLENEGIIKAVCDILEGGDAAFEKRKNRYRISL